MSTGSDHKKGPGETWHNLPLPFAALPLQPTPIEQGPLCTRGGPASAGCNAGVAP
eukprot:CAMPEP_0203846654 /NCGR_PEP_ID=MMETSP0359-20131031/4559_1 /ASSEMBLY_ACC=CAM_ASM_000338 /TAXON_ID=268821 /ORGANISM="Scrippsiella Hangoei, Strain SHTV-5" /LENGTH=54 /DNA_ID=CAMNT_0050762009 /DNA_START=107 /DNA_END=271 /DNA_ORIENTATION=-